MTRSIRITPSFLVAVVALVCAMAGTGYAAASISGKSVKKRSLPANRVVSDSLGGTQIDESKLGPVPAAINAINADKAKTAETADKATTADSAQTAQTAQSAQTAQTADNASKLEGHPASDFLRSQRVYRTALANDVASNAGAEVTANCLAGELAVGGGGAWFINNTQTTVSTSELGSSLPIGNGWRAEGYNSSAAVRDFRAYVVCVKIA